MGRDDAIDTLARWLLAKGNDRRTRDWEMARLTVDDRAAVLDRVEWLRGEMLPDYGDALTAVDVLNGSRLTPEETG